MKRNSDQFYNSLKGSIILSHTVNIESGVYKNRHYSMVNRKDIIVTGYRKKGNNEGEELEYYFDV